MRWSQQMDCIKKWYSAEEIENGLVEMSVDGKGTAPKPGQLFKNPQIANVLTNLGAFGAQRGFYQSFPGKSIVECIQKHGGVMKMEDLTNHAASTFPAPISVNYRGINVWEVPPNGQGIAGLIALEGLNALEQNGIVTSSSLSTEDMGNCDTPPHPQQSAEMLHAQIEMMRLGFGDARALVCDSDFASSRTKSIPSGDHSSDSNDGKLDPSSTEWLLNKERISKRALNLFDAKKAVVHGQPSPSSCTVSFQVVDEDGNAMSFVNRYVWRFLSMSL